MSHLSSALFAGDKGVNSNNFATKCAFMSIIIKWCIMLQGNMSSARSDGSHHEIKKTSFENQ